MMYQKNFKQSGKIAFFHPAELFYSLKLVFMNQEEKFAAVCSVW